MNIRYEFTAQYTEYSVRAAAAAAAAAAVGRCETGE